MAAEIGVALQRAAGGEEVRVAPRVQRGDVVELIRLLGSLFTPPGILLGIFLRCGCRHCITQVIFTLLIYDEGRLFVGLAGRLLLENLPEAVHLIIGATGFIRLYLFLLLFLLGPHVNQRAFRRGRRLRFTFVVLLLILHSIFKYL